MGSRGLGTQKRVLSGALNMIYSIEHPEDLSEKPGIHHEEFLEANTGHGTRIYITS